MLVENIDQLVKYLQVNLRLILKTLLTKRKFEWVLQS